MNAAIEATEVTKKYGNFVAVDNISFNVREGEIFGLLGPNGAGKSTTVRMLCTLLEPSAGHIRIRGLDLKKHANQVRKLIGVVFENQNVYDHLSGFYNLLLFARLYGLTRPVEKVTHILNMMKLEDKAHEPVYKYSKGMKQRLLIARALIHDPEILFLDEPTIGLDPQTAVFIRRLVIGLSKQGKTIFLTTHYMDEAEAICHQIAIIQQGRIIATGSPEALCSSVSNGSLYKVHFNRKVEPIIFNNLKPLETETSDVFTFDVNKTLTNFPLFIEHLYTIGKEDNNLEILKVERIKPSLQEAFIKLTGENLPKET